MSGRPNQRFRKAKVVPEAKPPSDDEEDDGEVEASQQREPSRAKPAAPRFKHSDVRTATFSVSWSGTLDQLQTVEAFSMAQLVNDPSALFPSGVPSEGESTQGVITGACVKSVHTDFPFAVIASSPVFESSHVVSPPGRPVQRGFEILYPGSSKLAVNKALVTKTKEINPAIVEKFGHIDPKNIESVSFITDHHGVETEVDIWDGNPLIPVLQHLSETTRRDEYKVALATSSKKERGLRIKKTLYDKLRTCYNQQVVPHLSQQDLSTVPFKLERVGADWSDPISPELADPRWMSTTFTATTEIEVSYKLAIRPPAPSASSAGAASSSSSSSQQ
ncbi:MAG: hypothetical protein BVN35_17725 [Proteobacteria bacterium ST_bin11]|nr:MAG: hypothetical protein BVN35_17725 [Proteobacteria bacterium ST_bin11]